MKGNFQIIVIVLFIAGAVFGVLVFRTTYRQNELNLRGFMLFVSVFVISIICFIFGAR